MRWFTRLHALQVAPDGLSRPRCTKRPQDSVDSLGPPYPATKLLAMRSYSRSVTPWRMLWTCSTLVLPAFVAAVVPVFVHLEHPRKGTNLGFYLHSISIAFTTTMGAVLHFTAPAAFTSADFSLLEMIAVSMIADMMNMIETLVLIKYWRFPIPFSIIVFSPLFYVNILVGLVIVLGRKLWTRPVFKRSVKLYGMCMNIQMVQIVVYPAISVLYDKANNTQRILLTMFFPVIKYGLKRLLKRVGRQLGEYQTEVAVCGVEICGSLYQSMIMQTVPSAAATGVIMGLDVVQGLVAIKLFADRHADPLVPRPKLFDEAERLLTLHRATLHSEPSQQTIQRALALALTAESILLVEYFEVIIPFFNGVFLVIAAQFPSAQYNSRIAPFYHDRDRLNSALLSLMTYSALQGLSCVAMHYVMKRRYGISAIAHLSFVLERYHQSILGMMISWLPIILHFTLMHYGSDFTFRFDLNDNTW